jgi:hypothetical protein
MAKDIWRIGLAHVRIEACLEPQGLRDRAVQWLEPGPAFTFLADPFGVWRDGRLHVFAEAYDYRTRRGVIDHLCFGPDLSLEARATVLQEAWHLSYPFVFEAEGETWMAPEAHRSGAFTLYRAVRFPDLWEPAGRFELDTPAIDPTLFRHGGLWWMAYAPTGPQAHKQGRLHLAYASQVTGPWTPHAGNPVRVDRASSRPGGTPFTADGVLYLPVQDCSATYGGGVRLLRIDALTADCFSAEAGPAIIAPAGAAPFVDGLHTLSSCGPLTLLDVKRRDRSPRGLLIDVAGRLGLRGASKAAP